MKCPNCKKEVSPDWEICPFCKYEPTKCSNPNCNFGWLPNDAIFCPSCGMKINRTTSRELHLKYKQEYFLKEDNSIYVDMGGSVLWATCNLGAKSPESYGDYYCWGETYLKDECTTDNYTYVKIKKSFGGLFKENVYQDIGSNISGTEYDVATKLLGKPWMIPSIEQLNELKKCKWKIGDCNGVRGRWVYAKNGNKLFLPASGYKYGTDIRGLGFEGNYPSSNIDTFYSKEHAWSYYNLSFDKSEANPYEGNSCGVREWGCTIRPVKKKQ